MRSYICSLTCQRNKIMFNKRSQNFYQGHSVNWYTWTYCCTVKLAIFVHCHAQEQQRVSKPYSVASQGDGAKFRQKATPLLKDIDISHMGMAEWLKGIVNDCDIAHLSNVVQWTMGSQLLGGKTNLSTKWSKHVLEAMWALRVPCGGSKKKKRPPRPWDKAEHWPQSHWSACSGEKKPFLWSPFRKHHW